MDNLQITPSSLQGSFWIPPSKSQTLRAILFGALAKGESQIFNYLPSPDAAAMLAAVRLLGARVFIQKDLLRIVGVAGKFSPAENVIDCGNSGLVLRLIGALAGLIPAYTILTGDASIRSRRPVKPLLSALSQLGVFAVSSRGDDYAPLIIRGPFTKSKAEFEGQDSQPVSGLLLAAAFAENPIELHVANPGEKPWVDLTLHWLKRLGIAYEQTNHTHYYLPGKAAIDAFTYKVPGDFSTAAFPLAAALITNSELTLENLDMEDPQGDKKILQILEKMGAVFYIDPEAKTITIPKNQQLQGISIDLNDCIDALPILAVIGCFAEGTTDIYNARIARKKESDRIFAMVSELKKMGAQIEEKEDGLIVRKSSLRGAHLQSHQDHRVALSLSVAALAASTSSKIENTCCIDKTYPNFSADFIQKGAHIIPFKKT